MSRKVLDLIKAKWFVNCWIKIYEVVACWEALTWIKIYGHEKRSRINEAAESSWFLRMFGFVRRNLIQKLFRFEKEAFWFDWLVQLLIVEKALDLVRSDWLVQLLIVEKAFGFEKEVWIGIEDIDS